MRGKRPHLDRRAATGCAPLVIVLTVVSTAIACYDLVLLALRLG